MNKLFHSPHYKACDYLSMQGVKLIHVSKKGLRRRRSKWLKKYCGSFALNMKREGLRNSGPKCRLTLTDWELNKWATICRRIFINNPPPPPPPPTTTTTPTTTPPTPTLTHTHTQKNAVCMRQSMGSASVQIMAPSHYLNQCWIIVYWTLRNKLKWNLYQNKNLSAKCIWKYRLWNVGHFVQGQMS